MDTSCTFTGVETAFLLLSVRTLSRFWWRLRQRGARAQCWTTYASGNATINESLRPYQGGDAFPAPVVWWQLLPRPTPRAPPWACHRDCIETLKSLNRFCRVDSVIPLCVFCLPALLLLFLGKRSSTQASAVLCMHKLCKACSEQGPAKHLYLRSTGFSQPDIRKLV